MIFVRLNKVINEGNSSNEFLYFMLLCNSIRYFLTHFRQKLFLNVESIYPSQQGTVTLEAILSEFSFSSPKSVLTVRRRALKTGFNRFSVTKNVFLHTKSGLVGVNCSKAAPAAAATIAAAATACHSAVVHRVLDIQRNIYHPNLESKDPKMQPLSRNGQAHKCKAHRVKI